MTTLFKHDKIKQKEFENIKKELFFNQKANNQLNLTHKNTINDIIKKLNDAESDASKHIKLLR